MGLDITAYRALTEVENAKMDEWGNPIADNQMVFRGVEYTEKHFPGRAAGVKENAIYEVAESYRFRAGSYSGYNRWRDQLAKLAGYASDEDCWGNHLSGPFWELINFFDNEGVIGPVVAAKLAKDFAEFRTKAETFDDEWFFERYDHWQSALEIASDNGVVFFH